MAAPGQVQQPIERFIASSIASVVLLAVPWIALAVAWPRSGRSTAGPLVAAPYRSPSSATRRAISSNGMGGHGLPRFAR